MRLFLLITIGLSFLAAGCEGYSPFYERAEMREGAEDSPDDGTAGGQPAADDEANAAAPATAETAPNVEERGVPIVYDRRFQYGPLSGGQLAEILRWSRSLAPRGTALWYILVRDNRGGSYNATAYFAPTNAADRLRRGQAVHLYQGMEDVIALRRKLSPDRPAGPFPHDYAQVAQVGKPFGETLDVPDKPCWPFEVCGQFADEDIVAVADAVRTRAARLAANGETTAGRDASAAVGSDEDAETQTIAASSDSACDADAPILSVIECENEPIEVRTGTRQGAFSGRGMLFRLIRKDADFFIVDECPWRQ